MMDKGLKPIIENNSKILILGSLPSKQSIRNQRYYDNKSNQFWKLISSVFENKCIDFQNYDEKISFLKKHNIALWDVLKKAQRYGSLDNNIKNEKYNDLKTLLTNSNINDIYVNGRKAERSLKKYTKDNSLNIEYKYLPSSSNLNTTYNFETKNIIWKQTIKKQI